MNQPPESGTPVCPAAQPNAAPPPAPRSRLRRWLFVTGAIVLLLGALTLGLLWYTGLLGDNFRAVVPGKCYRSGQLTPEQLRKYITAHGIKTVVNLRGRRNKADWYPPELQACEQLGCQHIDAEVNLGNLSIPQQVNVLVEALEHAPRPLLLHCRGGADRAGLASTLYLMIVEQQSLDKALSELSWEHGHFKVGRARRVDEFFEMYRATAEGRDIKRWIAEVYPRIFEERCGAPPTDDD